MRDADDGRLDPDRRTLLKGVGLGAAGMAGLGTAWSVGPSLLSGSSHSDHDAVLGLVPTAEATHVATGGRWAEASSWENGEVPDDEARVHVPAETTLTLDHEATVDLWTVRVDGTLAVDPASDTLLRCDTIVVTGEGTLTIGTADSPVRPDRLARVEFVDRGPIDESWDPARVSRGLLALDGARIRVHGPETTSWDALATPPTAGDSQLELAAAPTGWRPGDRLVVAGLRPDENEDEEVTIAGVDGATVRLEETLASDHVPPREDLDAYVANLERGVRFGSTSDAIDRRGHVMFMSRDVDVRYAGFYDLGRTEKGRPFTDPANGVPPNDAPPNPQARYACHFHRTGVDRSAAPRHVSGCVAWGSPGWGFVNHASYVDFVDNVAYQVFGAGFVAEIGTEVGSFAGNFALRSQGSGELPDSRQFHENSEGDIDDFGHGGHGFWFQGPGCAIEGNVAGGHRHFGFVFWCRGKPDESVPPDDIGGIVGEVPTFPIENAPRQADLSEVDDAADGTVPPSYVRLRRFRDNTVFGSGGGVDISRHRFGADDDAVEQASVVESFTAYNVGAFTSHWGGLRPPNVGGGQGGNNGISIRYSKHVHLRDVRLVGGAGDRRGVGVNHNHAPSHVSIDGADVADWLIGVRAFPHGDVPIENATFDNEVDVQLLAGAIDSRWSPQRAPLENVSFADGGRTNVFCAPELEGDLYGLFNPESTTTLNGAGLYHDAQRPGFVPIPTQADLEELRGDSLGDLTTAEPTALVGKTNAELWDAYGIAVDGEPVPDDARRDPGVEGGYVTGGTGLAGDDRAGPIELVISAAGSLFELGRLARGERLYVFDDPEFLAVPGTYAGLQYVRPEADDAGGDRPSFYHLRLSRSATVYVAYDAEASAGWLDSWTDTGDSLGTDDKPRHVYARETEAGTVILGACENTHRMYTVIARPR